MSAKQGVTLAVRRGRHSLWVVHELANGVEQTLLGHGHPVESDGVAVALGLGDVVDLVAEHGETDERHAVVHCFLVAVQASVRHEQLAARMGEQINQRRQPGRQTDVRRQTLDPGRVFPLPQHSLRQLRKDRFEDLPRRLGDARAAQNRAETQDDEAGVAGSFEERSQVLERKKSSVTCGAGRDGRHSRPEAVSAERGGAPRRR